MLGDDFSFPLEKTVDKGDNNSVYLNDTLTYSIKLTNRNDILLDDNTLSEINGYLNSDGSYINDFIVEEELNEYLEYVDLSANVFVNDLSLINNGISVEYDNDSRKIKWTINGNTLKQGSDNSIELTFKAKIPKNYALIGQKFESKGKIYNFEEKDAYITTGTVLNTIISKVDNYQKSYTECFNNLKNNYAGIELLNEIYNCSIGVI